MATRAPRRTIETTADQLRAIVLDCEVGALIGSEEALLAKLGCSRITMRQVARLLEREGLLKVRRGINGGYFASRPDPKTIEAAVSTYLESLDVDPQDVTVIASALWVEAMRKAAAADAAEARASAERMRRLVEAVRDSATFEEVREVELAIQRAVFDLARSAYIKLIFDINVAYSRRMLTTPIDDDSQDHQTFVRAWRNAKLLEAGAIAQGDPELAGMAGRHSRQLWHERLRRRFAPAAGAL